MVKPIEINFLSDIHTIGFQFQKTIENKMARLNGSIRDREMTMRGIKKTTTRDLPGMQIYHNYIRPHEALDGKITVEMYGIVVEGENKWMTLIQNAAKVK